MVQIILLIAILSFLLYIYAKVRSLVGRVHRFFYGD